MTHPIVGIFHLSRPQDILKALLVCMAFCSLSLNATAQSRSVTLRSPHGTLTFKLALEHGVPVYSINQGKSPVILPSRLGLAPSFAGDFRTLKASTEIEHNKGWKPLYGERDWMPDQYDQLSVSLEAASKKQLRLEVRAFDGGIAFRYRVSAPTTVDAEMTEFHLPAGTYAYEEHGGTEGKYHRSLIRNVAPLCQTPLTVELPNGTYAAILEAANVDFPLMTLGAEPGKSNTLVAELGGIGKLAASQFTPWRLIMWATTPGMLLEHDYLELDLNARDALRNTSWIKPGTAMREITLTDAGAYSVIDFDAAHSIDYILFDGGWYGYDLKHDDAMHVRTVDSRGNPVTPLHLQKIIAYARAHGIGVFLYIDYQQAVRERYKLFALYKKWGIAGVKIGFVHVGTQKDTAWVINTIRAAAKYHLMLDIHDQYRTTGYTRTYPNLLTVEGVRGNEHFPAAGHDATLPFTRYLAGTADYTICYFDRRLRNTHAHQLAMSIISYSPLQSIFWYDKPSYYHGEPEIKWFDGLPTTWDETRVPLGRIGEYSVEARRKGQRWYIGAITNSHARTIKLPMKFLQPGREYEATIYFDDPDANTATHVAVAHQRVTRNDVLHLALESRGGEAIMLDPLLNAAGVTGKSKLRASQ